MKAEPGGASEDEKSQVPSWMVQTQVFFCRTARDVFAVLYACACVLEKD